VRPSPALASAAPALAAAAVRGLGLTLRLTVAGTGAVAPAWRDGRSLIYALWHGQLLMAPWLAARLADLRGRRTIRVLASRSRDGELMARFAARFGLPAVRGSSSRGGAAALRALAATLRAGDDVVIAPDGPRGPRERVQPGVAALAAITGAPVVPVAFAARPAWRLRSWDAFLVPAPFARCAVVFGEPVRIARDEEREPARRRLERALAAATAAAEHRAGGGAVAVPSSEACR
jgi:lysophospholipid acyltransferase (LPLAT)-like uncharacterized protein